MAQKKTKTKQKKGDKDVKKEPTPPAQAPAESEPEEQPISVEPPTLPVPPLIAKQLPDYATSSISHDAAGHPVDKQKEPAEDYGWGAGDGGGWEGMGGSQEENDKPWSDDGAGSESEGHDDLKKYGDHDNLGWGQSDNPPHSINQDQPSLGQPVQNHVPTQVTSTPAPPLPSHPSPAPLLPPAALSVHTLRSDQFESAGHTKGATLQNNSQKPPHSEPKTYTFASSMANRNHPTSQPANSMPPSGRPSYYWAPNQHRAQKQSMSSTTNGQANPPLSNLTPWGQPKNVDPWGDPKPHSTLPPAPTARPPAPLATAQKRPAWYDWGRKPQTAVRAPPDRWTDYYDGDEYTDDGYTDDEYTDDDNGTHNVWGPPPNANHGWAPDPRKGYSGYQQQSQDNYLQAAHHYPEPSHHQLEKARRLKQIADEQRRSAMEMEMHKQLHDQGIGKSSKKRRHKGDDDNGLGAPKDEWGASSGWVNNGGGGRVDNSWGQWGNNEWNQSGNDREMRGANSWGNGEDGRDNGGDGWNNNGGDGWNNNGGDGWNNNSGDGWNNNSGDGWNSNGGDGWNNNSGDGWNNNGGDAWNNNGGDAWNNNGGDAWKNDSGHGWGKDDGDDWSRGNGGQAKGGKKDKSQGEVLDEEEGSGESSRYHVVTDSAQMSKTFMHAITEDLRPTKSSTLLRLGLRPGIVNESGNQAFEPALKAIFGKERLARDRIHWIYSPKNESGVVSILYWIEQMEKYLAFLGLLKFLETQERGALFVNVTFRLQEYPDQPVFDWLRYKQVQISTDRILQHSILATDPAEQTVVFVYLLSRTGNSVAMWRRKLQVPKDMRKEYLEALKKVKAGLRPDKDLIYVDELPPSDKGKQTKPAKLSRSKPAAKSKQATKTETMKLTKDQASAKPAKPAKPALKTHQRGQSLPTVPEKKRKWWQILRFAE